MYSDSTLIPYNNGWFFTAPDQPGGGLTEIPPAAVPVKLPHAWNEIGWSYENLKPDEPGGSGYYYKRLEKLSNESLAIKFEGVAAGCDIYLNGKRIGGNIGAYKPFTVNLDGVRRDGNDLLVIKVTDKRALPMLDPADAGGEFQVSPRYSNWAIPMGSSMNAGGIWRNVWLVSSPDCRMTGLKLRSGRNELQVTPEFSRDFTGRICCVLLDAAGNNVAEGSGDGMATLSVPDAAMWHPRHPALYTLRCELENGSNSGQEIEQQAAFFDFTIRNSEFYVNGKPYFLRGQNGPPHANIAHDRDYIRKYVAAVKAQGVEISRFHTEPPSHAWLDECDRQGVMVIFEMAIHGAVGCYAFDNPEFLRNAEAEILALIEEYRRHPSIVMWCLGNEMIVSCERDAGLAPRLFAILNKWIDKIRPLDPRPVIANSGGDGADQCHISAGDVDDMHQYGGWYVETLRDLRRYKEFTMKNEMLFMPAIVTESVAAYTDNDGCFFVKHGDARQMKVVSQRLGRQEATPEASLSLQAFILKEYAEQMWRLRRQDSNLAGYIPFGQYTWFSNPFDSGPDGLKPKPVWDMYRKVMSPLHVQLECWDRHCIDGKRLKARLLLCHEDILLPEQAELQAVISQGTEVLYSGSHSVCYHDNCSCELQLTPGCSESRLEVKVFRNGKCVAENYLDLEFYPESAVEEKPACHIYDPAGKLDGLRQYAEAITSDGSAPCSIDVPLLIGPYGYDLHIASKTDELMEWCSRGGTLIVLEQNPSWITREMFKSGIGAARQTQPHWSRWAGNMVRHIDRADLNNTEHYAFTGLKEKDFSWWNGDSFVANSCLTISRINDYDRVLMSAGNGLGDDELMPVTHPQIAPGVSTIMLEKKTGLGKIIFCQALAGTKFDEEPVAARMIMNLIAGSAGINGIYTLRG